MGSISPLSGNMAALYSKKPNLHIHSRNIRKRQRTLDRLKNQSQVGFFGLVTPVNSSSLDAYTRALGTQLLYDKPEDLVSLALARVGYERRQIDKNENVEDTFLVLVQTLEHAIGLVRQGKFSNHESGDPLISAIVAPGDPRLRLERYLADIVSVPTVYENRLLRMCSTRIWQALQNHLWASCRLQPNITSPAISHGKCTRTR